MIPGNRQVLLVVFGWKPTWSNLLVCSCFEIFSFISRHHCVLLFFHLSMLYLG